MTPKMRRHLPGTFLARDLGQGSWRLARGDAPPIEVFLRGADPGAAEALRGVSVSDIDIEWRGGRSSTRDDTVVLTLTSTGRRRSIETRSAIVHEPLARLYEDLPLVDFDAKAKRFWRRVFALVRIPGGRHLLGVLARRTRGGH